jgi:ATP-binding cassette subfamily F protein 3
MSLLIFENIEKEYNNRVLLNKVNLRVERGERLALVGPNGTGKTTMLKIAMGLEESDLGKVILAKGIKVGYLSQDVKYLKAGEEGASENALFFEEVSRLEQKIRALEKQLEESDPIENQGLLDNYTKLLNRYEAMDGYNIELKIKKIMLGLGLRPEALTIPIDRLSGGEKMRVAMARILLEEPDLLILDEPTNHLDIQAAEWLEDFLKRFDGGVLLVSHDRYFLDQVATRVAELENGSITERSGNYTTFFEQKNKMREYVLKEQKKLRWKVKEANELIQSLKSKGKAKTYKSREIAVNKLQEEVKEKLGNLKEREHLKRHDGPKVAFKKIKHVSKDIVRVEKFKKSFGKVVLFEDASFHIRGGENVAILGPNGCGKTTLINILTGLDRDYEGTARLGEWVKYSYLGQEISFEDEDRTVMEQILSKKEMTEVEVRQLLGKFQFYGEDVYKQIFVLSGGEKVRLFLACILLEDADCLIMDEPTNHLDVSARESLENAISDFKGTVIAISHDRYFLTHCIDRILAVEHGKVKVYAGNYEFYKEQKLFEAEEKKAKEQLKADKSRSTSVRREDNSMKKPSEQKKKQLISTQKLEVEIMELEQKVKEYEQAFKAETAAEIYIEYDEGLKKLQDLYDLWEEI